MIRNVLSSSANLPGIILRDLDPDLDDEQLQLLQQRATPKKKGRPSNMPSIPVDNRLLLQLNLLRYRGMSGSIVQAVFDDICKHQKEAVPPFPVAPLIRTCVGHVQKISTVELPAFLATMKDIAFVGPFSKKIGISKAYLLGEESVPVKLDFIPVGLLLELDTFFSQKKFMKGRLVMFLEGLCVAKYVNPTVLLPRLNVLRKELHRKQQKKKTAAGKVLLKQFLESPWISDVLPASTSAPRPFLDSPRISDVLPASTSAPRPCPLNPTPMPQPKSTVVPLPAPEPCPQKKFQCVSLSRQQEEGILIKDSQVTAMRELLDESKKAITIRDSKILGLTKEISSQRQRLKSAASLVVDLKKKVSDFRKKCATQNKSSLYHRCQRLRVKVRELTNKAGNLQEAKQGLADIKQELGKEKKRKRSYQVYASQTKAKKLKVDHELESANQEIENLQISGSARPTLKLQSGQYHEPVVKCVMQLMAECEVPARRCSKIMQTVASHLFHVQLAEHSLPSKTSVLRFADQAHSLAKMHIAEKLATTPYDLHSDGATKYNKKYVGFQVTLGNKETLSLGFEPIAHETAQTLLDITLDKLSEFAAIFSPTDSANQLRHMLENMVGVMTDRASVMKAFSKRLDEHRDKTVGDAVRLEFLHCNAHFLLGLSTAAEKALTKVSKERELKGKLGRETMAAFRFFNSEAAACRYVRMACDILGPQGDEQCGCQHFWLAFCDSEDTTGIITSYRGNRFNNMFSAAAALIHHRDDIRRFFAVKTPTNLKQESVLADAACETLTVTLLGLALMFVFFSGPFWIHVTSGTHYLDQYQFIQQMIHYLKEMVQHPDMLLDDANMDDGLKAFRLRDTRTTPVTSVLQLRAHAYETDKPLLLHVLKVLAEEFVEVAERQLKDFLVDGKYGSAPTDEARERMQHCQLNNLLGEACFADLDYSMFKNRRATLHHHATTAMGKRNRPVSSFLDQKTSQEQSQLLARARKLGPEMRSTSNQQQRKILEELQSTIAIRQAQQQAREAGKVRQKMKVADQIQAQGGQCKSRQDVTRLLDSLGSNTDKVNALKIQIRNLKIFYDAKDDRLIMNHPLPKLSENLSSFLDDTFARDNSGEETGEGEN